MVLFMLAAAHVYSRLWNAYKVDPRADTEVQFHLHGQYLRKECRQYAPARHDAGAAHPEALPIPRLAPRRARMHTTDPLRSSFDLTHPTLVRYAIIPIGAVVMWTLLGLAYYLDDDMFWDALV